MIRDQSNITSETPLRLAEAARLAFPDGSMKVSGLRKEIAKGRLVVERIAGKDYTTPANIGRMRELCRVERKAQDCGCSGHGKVATESTPPRGASLTGKQSEALASARAKLRKLRQLSPTTSLASTDPRGSAIVTPCRQSRGRDCDLRR